MNQTNNKIIYMNHRMTKKSNAKQANRKHNIIKHFKQTNKQSDPRMKKRERK